MRVLHIINGLDTGGAETVLYRLTTFRSNVEHEVVCLEGRGTFSGRLEAAGVRVHHLNWKSLASSPFNFVRLCRLIRRRRPDLVQSWMYRSNIIAGFAGRLAAVPVIWNIRASSIEPLRAATRVLARLGGIFAPWLPRFVINCSSLSAQSHAKLGYDAIHCKVIPNGYDPAAFYPDEELRAVARARLNVGPDAFLIGMIARWHVQKGFPILLDAVELVRKRGIGVRVVLAGRGVNETNVELAQLITRHGVRDSLQLLDERGDVADLARALDLHVLASIGGEGFPNVVAETMLSGTPNAATDVGETRLIVCQAGWVIPPADADKLADAIEAAFVERTRAPKQWRERKIAARRRIADNFSLTGMVRGYEAVWNSVLTHAV